MAEHADDISTLLAQERHGRRWGWVLAALFLAAAGIGTWAYMSNRTASTGGTRYVTEPATRGTLTVTVIATGTVQPTRQVEVSTTDWPSGPEEAPL